ncbi:MAG: hypothetical protein WAL95_20440 [Candidatus Acidiferrales bacterium]
MTRKQAQALEVVLLAINAARKAGLSDAAILEAINVPIYPQRVSGGLKPKQSDRQRARPRGDHMNERWDVSSWDSHVGERAKQFQGCFESKIAADRFIVSASREHPDKRYRVEQCNHPEHGRSKAASA